MNYKLMTEKDKEFQIEKGAYPSFRNRIVNDHKYLIYKYIKYVRKDEYWSKKSNFFFINKILIKRKKNNLGAKLGLLIPNYTCDSGLIIWHYGNVIVNLNAKIGKNCQFHGDNCVGNKGGVDLDAPVIGDNVDIGIGAKIIGKVYIANNVRIGANAVVTVSCYIEGATLVGCPAKVVEKKYEK